MMKYVLSSLVALSALSVANAANYRYEWVPAPAGTIPEEVLNIPPYNLPGTPSSPTPTINPDVTWGEIIITEAAYNSGSFSAADGLVSFKFEERTSPSTTIYFDNLHNRIEAIQGVLNTSKDISVLSGVYDGFTPNSKFPSGVGPAGVWVGLGYFYHAKNDINPEGAPDGIIDASDAEHIWTGNPNFVDIGSDPQYYGQWIFRGAVDDGNSTPELTATLPLLMVSVLSLAALRRRRVS